MSEEPKARLGYCNSDDPGVMISMCSSPITKDSTEVPMFIDIVVNDKFNNQITASHIRLGPNELVRLGWWLRDMYKEK